MLAGELRLQLAQLCERWIAVLALVLEVVLPVADEDQVAGRRFPQRFFQRGWRVGWRGAPIPCGATASDQFSVSK